MIIYDFIKNLRTHIKYTKILKNVYKYENFIDNLSKTFGVQFKIDWIGRIYAVINPNITNGQYDKTTQIFEYNENGLDNSAFIERQIMEKMNIISHFIQSNNLFDILTYNIKKIDEYGNYLFVIQSITLGDLLNSIKKLSILLIVLIILILIYINLNIF